VKNSIENDNALSCLCRKPVATLHAFSEPHPAGRIQMNDWTEAEHRVEKAQRFFEQRKWGEALRELQLATSVNPYNSSWFFNMGLILDEMGRFEEAVEAYQEA